MESNNIFIIIGGVAIITFAMLWWAAKNAQEIKPPPAPKFEPRKMTDLSKGEIGSDPVAPKKKYYRKNYKKKPVDAAKKPVGRPKKSE
jgi:hypothetical protein